MNYLLIWAALGQLPVVMAIVRMGVKGELLSGRAIGPLIALVIMSALLGPIALVWATWGSLERRI